MSGGLLASDPMAGEVSPDQLGPARKARRISSAGDVAAVAVLFVGGLIGVVCLPVLALAHAVQSWRHKRKKRRTQAEEESDPDYAQDDDARWPFAPAGERRGKASELPAGTTRHTGYVTMSDGVRIAVDVLLPACAQDADGTLRPVPTVVHTARYWRAFELRWPLRELLNRGEPWDFLLGPWKVELVRSGFAVVSADVRGAGASGGVQSVVWSDRETQDTLELIDFIVGSGSRPRQQWSDGQVALFGVSYDAGAAVRAAAQKHPAVKALVASFLFGDIWRELFPGGVMNRWFLQHWCDVNARLDNARVSKIHPMAPLMIRGAAPVACRKEHRRFVAEHRDNWDLMAAAGSIEAIDDPVKLNSGETMSCQSLEIFSNPLQSLEGQAVLPSLAKSELPVLLISGWMCVTSASACAAFSALAGKSWRLLIGPWNHGGVQQIRYCRETKLLKFPKAEAVNEFLLHHLSAQKNVAPPAWLASEQPEAHFYVCGAKPAWQHSTSWPPQNVAKKPLWLSKSRELSWTKPVHDESDGGASQLPVATGQAHLVWGGVSRYNAMIKMMDLVKYQWKQSAVDSGKALLFETPALAAPVAMLGSPVLSLRLRGAGDEDADVFAYLCERPPDGGDLVYVTEGILRLSKRKEEDAPDHEKAADPDRSRCGNSAKAAEIDAGFVPHHSYRREDIEMLPAAGGLTTARLKMFAAAYRFRAGSRMALVIAPDDAAHYTANKKAGRQPPVICHSAAESSLLWLPLEGDSTTIL